ncbi:toll/interleukin-1 receptor domain-containing protein [Legionella oakridgensis]|uniref:TIR domain protein n=1 Tax=Legionella oakridgensis TaxID=29423 RepID=A0A0W0WYE2_9GAMM|nr:toll/interleukin-1 receptor domain-containing protein [Legionella oakridgensis]KTD37331.1 TIR domain protein [Legionella oakridgensis]STY15757.1 TIR domain [Legionella longbeachae]
MNTLKNYYDNDFQSTLKLSKTFTSNQNNSQIIGTLHLDFMSNSKFISYYIPDNKINILDQGLQNFLLDTNQILDWSKEFLVSGGLFFEHRRTNEKMIFTNIVYIYSNTTFSDQEKNLYIQNAYNKGLILLIRDSVYIKKRAELEKPRAFISHDSRDKNDFVRPLCENLRSRLCTVWYDEFSLRVGDNLRESIEDGIKKCNKCIVIISPAFISNTGWSKKEFESIFQREISDGKTVVLPIWHNVTRNQVYEYCSSFTNVVALNSAEGIDLVANKLFDILMNPKPRS